MTISTTQALREVTTRTLQSLAFLLPAEDGQEPDCSAGGISVRVNFTGPFAGCLALTVPHSLLPALTANMLGLSGGAACSLEQERDALGELGHVICGNLLPVIGGAQAVFDLTPPEVQTAALPPMPGASTVTVALDEGWARLQLLI